MLNEKLYKRIEKVFEQKPGIINEGMEAEYKTTRLRDGSFKAKVEVFGEAYTVNCRFCGDTRERLNISYTYGLELVKDDKVIKFPHSWICYNETQCANGNEPRKKKNRHELYEALIAGEPLRVDDRHLQKAKKEKSDSQRPLPYNMVPIANLLDSHEARSYLLNRGINSGIIREANVQYIKWDPSPILKGRIFFPAYSVEDPKDCIGGQARYIEDDGSGIKYYTVNKLPSRSLYGYHRLKDKNFAVVVEGPLDVLALKGYGLGIYSCAITRNQLKLLSKFKTIVIALDPDLKEKNESMFGRLQRQIIELKSASNVYQLTLPDGYDPGDLGFREMFKLIKKQFGIIWKV